MKIFDPCKTCLVRATCRVHGTCEEYQKWRFKEWFCDHDWVLEQDTYRFCACKKCHKIAWTSF